MRVLTSPTTNKQSASSRREIWHFLYRELAYVCSMPNIILSPCVVISNKFQIYTNYVLINVWQIHTVFHVKKKFLFFLSDNSIGKNNLRSDVRSTVALVHNLLLTPIHALRVEDPVQCSCST